MFLILRLIRWKITGEKDSEEPSEKVIWNIRYAHLGRDISQEVSENLWLVKKDSNIFILIAHAFKNKKKKNLFQFSVPLETLLKEGNFKKFCSKETRWVLETPSQKSNSHCVKSVRIGSYSGPYFPSFGLNTDRYSVSLRIQSECVKIRTRKTPNTDTFCAVSRTCTKKPRRPRTFKNSSIFKKM